MTPGFFEPLKDVIDPVQQGEVIALIHDPMRPDRPAVPVTATHDGIILAKRAMGRCRRGDALFELAKDA